VGVGEVAVSADILGEVSVFGFSFVGFWVVRLIKVGLDSGDWFDHVYEIWLSVYVGFSG
jgi:hypothetical protein